MKKILNIIIILTLSIFLTGCAIGKTESNEIVLNTNGGVP